MRVVHVFRLVMSFALAVGAVAIAADGTPNGTRGEKGQDAIELRILETYPKAMQETYANLFAKRCSKCHSLALSLNADNAPTKWEECIKKMMRKPGSGITKDDAKKIWQFVVYDMVKRKERFFETLPDSEKNMAKEMAAETERAEGK